MGLVNKVVPLAELWAQIEFVEKRPVDFSWFRR